jgi:flagellar biosynthesis/type III secretory pathway M-ring protein FliF/YscJ
MPSVHWIIPPQYVWPALLVAAGVVALIVLALLVRLLLRNERSRDPLSRKESTLTVAQQRSIERDITALMDELSEMSRQVGRELDARSSRLETLIRSAEEKIERLEELNGAHPSNPSRVVQSVTGVKEDPVPRHVEVYTLADEGLALAEIAQRLKRPNGDVELILALRPRRVR